MPGHFKDVCILFEILPQHHKYSIVESEAIPISFYKDFLYYISFTKERERLVDAQQLCKNVPSPQHFFQFFIQYSRCLNCIHLPRLILFLTLWLFYWVSKKVFYKLKMNNFLAWTGTFKITVKRWISILMDGESST